jgi:hypothetical protein
MADSAQGRAPSQKPSKNQALDTDAAYLTPAERRLVERAAAALQWARLRAREGEGVFRVSLLAARHGWAYRTAIAAVEQLEGLGAVQCVARRGRDWWTLTDGSAR